MIDPLLYGSLHLHLHKPIDIIGCGFIVRGLCHELVNLLLGVFLGGVVSVDFHPRHKLLMIYDVLLERVAHIVHIIHMHSLIVGIHLAAALIHGQEYRLNAAGGLCHE